MLGAALAMRADRSKRKFLIVFSDLLEDRSEECDADLDLEIDLSGVDVLFVDVKKLERDRRDPVGYNHRIDEWVDWVYDRNARSADILDDGRRLAATLAALRENAVIPPRKETRTEERAVGLEESSQATSAPAPSQLAQRIPNTGNSVQEPLQESRQPANDATPPLEAKRQSAQAPQMPPSAPVAAPATTGPPEIIARPVWIRRPTDAEFARLYPERALERRRNGSATLGCTVQSSGLLACSVLGEEPRGLGFGAAGLDVARLYRMAQYDADNHATLGRRYVLKLAFRVQ